MSANGRHGSSRPRIELVSPARSASEAAAVVAAVEQFLADTAPAPADAKGPASGWQTAALREGIAARHAGGGGWGHAPSWSERT